MIISLSIGASIGIICGTYLFDNNERKKWQQKKSKEFINDKFLTHEFKQNIPLSEYIEEITIKDYDDIESDPRKLSEFLMFIEKNMFYRRNPDNKNIIYPIKKFDDVWQYKEADISYIEELIPPSYHKFFYLYFDLLSPRTKKNIIKNEFQEQFTFIKYNKKMFLRKNNVEMKDYLDKFTKDLQKTLKEELDTLQQIDESTLQEILQRRTAFLHKNN